MKVISNAERRALKSASLLRVVRQVDAGWVMPFTLVEKAKAQTLHRTGYALSATDEELTLAVAYMYGEVSRSQMGIALEKGPTWQCHQTWTITRLRQGIRDGRLRLLKRQTDDPSKR